MLIAGIIAILVMIYIPPWVHEYRNEFGVGRTVGAGYGTLANPPSTSATYNLYSTHIDVVLLLIQLVAAAGITFGALVYLADRNPDTARLMRRYRRH